MGDDDYRTGRGGRGLGRGSRRNSRKGGRGGGRGYFANGRQTPQNAPEEGSVDTQQLGDEETKDSSAPAE